RRSSWTVKQRRERPTVVATVEHQDSSSPGRSSSQPEGVEYCFRSTGAEMQALGGWNGVDHLLCKRDLSRGSAGSGNVHLAEDFAPPVRHGAGVVTQHNGAKPELKIRVAISVDISYVSAG